VVAAVSLFRLRLEQWHEFAGKALSSSPSKWATNTDDAAKDSL
jgi:hypothetical protein